MNLPDNPEILERFNQANNELELYMGNKCLTLSLPEPPELEFVTSIVNVSGDVPIIPGATTALYTRAKEVMQETANGLEARVTYTFITDHAKMISWAKSHGRRIFHWSIRQDSEDEFVAERTFDPEM